MLCRNRFKSINAAVTILVIAALLLSLLPTHLHLHHVEDVDIAAHQHVIDLHITAVADDQGHHEEAHVVNSTVDGLLKQLGSSVVPALLASFLLLLLPLVNLRLVHYFAEAINQRKKSVFRISPPLRAPPAH